MTYTIAQTDSRIIEQFDAPHVEGPIRLDDEQTYIVRDPSTLDPASSLRLSVRKLDQVQSWRDAVAVDAPDRSEMTQTLRVEYRDQKLIDADRGFGAPDSDVALLVANSIEQEVLVDDEGNVLVVLYAGDGDTIPNTVEELDDDVVDPPTWFPRSRTVRVKGGWMQIHGTTGVISRVNAFGSEL